MTQLFRTKKLRRSKKAPKPYKSWLEYNLATNELKDWEYEPVKLKFKQPEKARTYTPDFSNNNIHIEVKGRVSRVDDLLKVVWCREQYPEKRFVWIISNGNIKAYPQSNQTLGEWLTSNGFEWYTVKDVEEFLRCLAQ